jgi:dCMP deaminase
MHAKMNSDDPSTQCGAVLVPAGPAGYRNTQVCFGTNHFPKGVKVTPDRLADRDTKLFYMVHAERDVIYKAALRGISTLDATLYVPWFACADCAQAIIQSGITRVVGHQAVMDKTPERWMESIQAADQMLDEAGVKREYYTRSIFDNDFKVLFDGGLWTP